MMVKTAQTVTMIRSSHGFTFIELLVAMAILSLGMLAVAKLQATGAHNTGSARVVTEGAQLASDQIEFITNLSYGSGQLQDTDQDGSAGLNDTGAAADIQNTFGIYTISTNVAEDDFMPDSKTVKVIVTSTYRGDARRVELQKIITPYS